MDEINLQVSGTVGGAKTQKVEVIIRRAGKKGQGISFAGISFNIEQFEAPIPRVMWEVIKSGIDSAYNAVNSLETSVAST